MAEAFGIVTGALSAITLFKACVDGFKYIQAGRDRDKDYERLQVKLTVAWNRLEEWGRRVGIRDDSRFRELAPSDRSIQLIQSVLNQLKLLFDSVEESTGGYGQVPETRHVVKSGLRRSWSRSHSTPAPTRKSKLRWALYDKGHLTELVQQINGFIKDLEKLEKLVRSRHAPGRSRSVDIRDIEQSTSAVTLEDEIHPGNDAQLLPSTESGVESAGDWISPMRTGEGSTTQGLPAWPEEPVFTQSMQPYESYDPLETSPTTQSNIGMIPYQDHDVWQGADSNASQSSQHDGFDSSRSHSTRASMSSAPMATPDRERSLSWQHLQHSTLRRHSEPDRPAFKYPRGSRSSFKIKNSKTKRDPQTGGNVLKTGLEDSTILAVAVEGCQIAYLTISGLHLFTFTWGLELYTSCYQDLSTITNWKGIAFSGRYLAVWGVSDADQSLLSIYFIQDDDAGGWNLVNIELPFHDEIGLASFDNWKRVAVSATGFVACINDTKVLLISIQNDCHVTVLDLPGPDGEFIDIAFNEDGSTLYAWAMVNIDGVLMSWRILDPYNATLESVSYYDCDTNESICGTRLFPYPSSPGCIVGASASQLFFPGNLGGGTKIQHRRLSDELKKSKVRAACMSSDHSFLVIRKISGRFRKEFHIVEHSLLAGKTPSFGDSRELYRLQHKPQKGSQLGAYHEGSTRYILICHLDGMVEVEKLGRR